uniref:Uncharacterized protein n=1 Tax=Stegastes partitus TaxID=144197 RepID=A0A3B5ARM1_9TELE
MRRLIGECKLALGVSVTVNGYFFVCVEYVVDCLVKLQLHTNLSRMKNWHLIFISSLAGLESVRRLQRLSLDHNQLISTKGLKDVYTLLHLDCSHNHLANVEGLENNALLHTLDLRGNSLTEVKRCFIFLV